MTDSKATALSIIRRFRAENIVLLKLARDGRDIETNCRVDDLLNNIEDKIFEEMK